jgi:hypothetical protein
MTTKGLRGKPFFLPTRCSRLFLLGPSRSSHYVIVVKVVKPGYFFISLLPRLDSIYWQSFPSNARHQNILFRPPSCYNWLSNKPDSTETTIYVTTAWWWVTYSDINSCLSKDTQLQPRMPCPRNFQMLLDCHLKLSCSFSPNVSSYRHYLLDLISSFICAQLNLG